MANDLEEVCVGTARQTQCVADSPCYTRRSSSRSRRREGTGGRGAPFSSGHHIAAQTCLAVLLFVSATTLAAATSHHSWKSRGQRSTSSGEGSRRIRGIGPSAMHWNLYRFVATDVPQPQAQCDAGCMSRTELDSTLWQPFTCDKKCKECRNVTCKSTSNWTSCLERCNTTRSPEQCQDMCDVMYNSGSKLQDAVGLPDMPKSGPQPIISHSLSSQWLVWVGLEHIDETDPVAVRDAQAVLYIVRRLQLRYVAEKDSVEEVVASQYLSQKATLRTKRLFRNSNSSPAPASSVCYRFDVATVNKNGLKGFMKNDVIYHPSSFGLEANSTAPCWKRLCTDPGQMSTSPQSLRLKTDSMKWMGNYWRVEMSWQALPKSRCHRIILTTPDADRARCGEDREILMLESQPNVLLRSLVEQCDFTITVIDLPSGATSSLKFRTPNSDSSLRVRDVLVGDLKFDTSAKRRPGGKVYLTTNITWLQPQVTNDLHGFCLQLFQSSQGVIAQPQPSIFQCRNDRIQVQSSPDARYRREITSLEPGRQYQLELATMVYNRFATITKTVFFTTPKLRPSNMQLLSLNKAKDTAVIGWTFNEVMSLREQGGKLHFVWLEVPPNSFLARDLEEEEQEVDTERLGETSLEGGYARVVQERRRKTTLDETGGIVPSSALSSLSDWSTLQQYISSNTSHSGVLEVELQKKDAYTVTLHSVKKDSQYVVLIFGPAANGSPGLASPTLLFTTSPKKTEIRGSGNATDSKDKPSDSFWTRGHVASVVIPAAGAVILLLVLVVILILVYLCKQGTRRNAPAATATTATRRKPRTSHDGALATHGANNLFNLGPQTGPGHVLSRPATWIAHDANAVPNANQPIIADSSDAEVTYSPFSALGSPSHPARRVASFSGVGSPTQGRRPSYPNDGPSIELRRAPSGRSCVHAVEFSAVRPGSPHPLHNATEKNIFLSTIYGDTAFTRDSLRRSKSSHAAIGSAVPPKVSPKPSAKGEAFLMKDMKKGGCITTMSSASMLPRVSTCSSGEVHSHSRNSAALLIP